MQTRNNGHVITCTWRMDQPKIGARVDIRPSYPRQFRMDTSLQATALPFSGGVECFDSQKGQDVNFFSKQSRLALGSAQTEIGPVWYLIYCIYITHAHLGRSLWLCRLYLRSAIWRDVHRDKRLRSIISSKDLHFYVFIFLLCLLPSRFLLSFLAVLDPFTICSIRSCLSIKGTLLMTLLLR
jgi:hypothetical protein